MTRPPGGLVVTGAEVASYGLTFRGLGYVFGGNASYPGDWDCSSFVSYVFGKGFNLALPGGRWGEPGFPPYDHGPVVTDYAGWNLAVTIPQGQEAAGDLACFVGVGANGHIGIVTGPNRMISALNPAIGTAETPIVGYGPYGAPLEIRRPLFLTIQPGTSPGVPPTGYSRSAFGRLPVINQLFLIAVALGGMTAAVIGGAALAGGLVLVTVTGLGQRTVRRG